MVYSTVCSGIVCDSTGTGYTASSCWNSLKMICWRLTVLLWILLERGIHASLARATSVFQNSEKQRSRVRD